MASPAAHERRNKKRQQRLRTLRNRRRRENTNWTVYNVAGEARPAPGTRADRALTRAIDALEPEDRRFAGRVLLAARTAVSGSLLGFARRFKRNPEIYAAVEAALRLGADTQAIKPLLVQLRSRQ